MVADVYVGIPLPFCRDSVTFLEGNMKNGLSGFHYLFVGIPLPESSCRATLEVACLMTWPFLWWSILFLCIDLASMKVSRVCLEERMLRSFVCHMLRSTITNVLYLS